MWLRRVDRRMGAAAFCRTGNHFWIHALHFTLTTPSPHPHHTLTVSHSELGTDRINSRNITSTMNCKCKN